MFYRGFLQRLERNVINLTNPYQHPNELEYEDIFLNDDKYLKLKTSKWGALEAENQSSEVLSLSFDRVTSCFKQRSSKKYKKFKSVSTIIFWEIATI